MSERAAKILSIVSAFGLADAELPEAAMRSALASWDEISDVLIDCLDAVSREPDVDVEDASTAFFLGHLAADKRDGRAFAPLCSIGRQPELTESVFGDILTETYGRLLASTFDGDPGPLQALIEDDAAEEYARSEGLLALAWLTAHQRLPVNWTTAYLERLSHELPRTDCFVWYGWQRAIAALQLRALEPLVRQAFETGLLASDLMSFADFQEDFRQGAAILIGDKVEPVDDMIAEMSGWYCFSEEARRARREELELSSGYGDAVPMAPATNPFRDIGRNDPCLCGSGKKFKKCCLAQA